MTSLEQRFVNIIASDFHERRAGLKQLCSDLNVAFVEGELEIILLHRCAVKIKTTPNTDIGDIVGVMKLKNLGLAIEILATIHRVAIHPESRMATLIEICKAMRTS